MNQDIYWNQFEKTGRIEDYLKFSNLKSEGLKDQEEGGHDVNTSSTDRDCFISDAGRGF